MSDLKLVSSNRTGKTETMAQIICEQMLFFFNTYEEEKILVTAGNIFQLGHLRQAVLTKLDEADVDYDFEGGVISHGRVTIEFVTPEVSNVVKQYAYVFVDNIDHIESQPFLDCIETWRAHSTVVSTESE